VIDADGNGAIELFRSHHAEIRQFIHQLTQKPSLSGNDEIRMFVQHQAQQRRARSLGADDEHRTHQLVEPPAVSHFRRSTRQKGNDPR
jgi:hypothetical protein